MQADSMPHADRLCHLLHAHAAAWWRDITAPDYVEQVNATYEAYIAAGGTDEHYNAHWRAYSDAAASASAKARQEARDAG